MQIAYKAGSAKDRRIYLRGIELDQLDLIKGWGFTYNKVIKAFEALPSLQTIEVLEQYIKLPEPLAKLKQELQQAQELIDAERLKSSEQVQELVRAPIKGKLYAHQQKALQMALQRFKVGEGFGLFFEMGCGKTLTAIAIAGCMYQQKKIERVLICCPSSIISVWQEDLSKFAGFELSIGALQGSKDKRLKELSNLTKISGLKFAIINYESTHRKGIKEALEEYNADLIICDESQRIKSHNAAQSKCLHTLGDKAKYKLILSGTPVQNSCIDVWSQYRFLDPSIFGKSFFSFKAHYTISGGFQGHQIIGYRDIDGLIKKAHSIAYRVTKDECLDLPDQVFINREFELEKEARAAYDDLKNDSVTELSKGTVTANTVLTQILRLQQLTGGFINTDEGKIDQVSSAKLELLKEILEDYLESGKKAVIFARFTPELKAIKKLLSDMGVQYGFIDGSVKIEDRGAIVTDFQTNKDTKIFLAQNATAGLGITLTAAPLTIFYSLSYNYADYSQCLSRTHRIGQKEKCTYINLIAKNTIDAKILKALDRKENNAKYIVDNWRAYFE